MERNWRSSRDRICIIGEAVQVASSTDCKSAGIILCWFNSSPPHQLWEIMEYLEIFLLSPSGATTLCVVEINLWFVNLWSISPILQIKTSESKFTGNHCLLLERISSPGWCPPINRVMRFMSSCAPDLSPFSFCLTVFSAIWVESSISPTFVYSSYYVIWHWHVLLIFTSYICIICSLVRLLF